MNSSTPTAPVNTSSQEPISEAASEKRGRPKVFSDFYLANMSAIGDKQHCSHRTKQNYCYSIRALSRLIESDRAAEFLWLCDETKMTAGMSRSWKPELLVELGRITTDELFFAMAEALCREKPKTKVGIAWIRRARYIASEEAGE